LLEDLPEQPEAQSDGPRASLVLAAGAIPGLSGNVWMGGAHSLTGQPMDVSKLKTAIVIDCAGEMPREFRAASLRWVPNVFQDVDAWPMHFDRLEMNVIRAAEMVRSPVGPIDVYAMCTHGMNRSGLVAGLLLRALGIGGPESLRLVQAARPGALSNETFRRIVESESPDMLLERSLRAQ